VLELDSANERTLNANKKTIMPLDVFDALDEIEYPEFKDLVQQEFKSKWLLPVTYGLPRRTIYSVYIVAQKQRHPELMHNTCLEFNEVQSSKRNTYRRKVAAAKKGVPYVDTPGLLREPRVPDATGPPGTTFIEDPAAAAGIDTSRSIKKQRMSSTHPANGTNGTDAANPDDSAMTGFDGDTTQEYQDADSEPDEPIDEDDEELEDDVVEEEEDDDDDDEEGEGRDDEMHDALEEREEQGGEDEALDNGEDSDS
jgi:hypothetical protein